MQRIIWIILSALVWSGCLKDTGNYTYTPLATVTIGNVNDVYRVFLQDSLKIQATVTTTIPEADLEYNWMIGKDTLRRTKEFNYTFTTQAITQQALVFEVRNKKNNTRTTKSIQLTVVSAFQTGWALLSEKNNKGYLSFYSYENGNPLYKNLYQLVNGDSLGSEPLSVKQLLDFDVNRLSIMCKGGKSCELDGTNMKRMKYYANEFRITGAVPVAINVEQFVSERYFFIFSGGLIYCKIPGYSSVDDSWYQYPLPGDAKGYSVGKNYAKATTLDYYVTYDELNKRYVRFIRNTFNDQVTSLNLVAGTTPAFNPDMVEGTNLWMGRSSTGKILSVIKNPAGQYVLHVMTNRVVSGRDQYTADAAYVFANGVVTDASCFAPHGNSPYLFIGTGSNLSALNLEALAQGSVAVNNLRTYNGDITAITYAYNALKGINELALGLKTADPEFPGSLLLINPNLSAGGAILKQIDQVGGVIKSICRKVQ